VVHNVRVKEKRPFEELEQVLDLVREAEAAVVPRGGRVLLRYSGTEPKARLLIEGPDNEELERWSAVICGAISRQIGA